MYQDNANATGTTQYRQPQAPYGEMRREEGTPTASFQQGPQQDGAGAAPSICQGEAGHTQGAANYPGSSPSFAKEQATASCNHDSEEMRQDKESEGGYGFRRGYDPSQCSCETEAYGPSEGGQAPGSPETPQGMNGAFQQPAGGTAFSHVSYANPNNYQGAPQFPNGQPIHRAAQHPGGPAPGGYYPHGAPGTANSSYHYQQPRSFQSAQGAPFMGQPHSCSQGPGPGQSPYACEHGHPGGPGHPKHDAHQFGQLMGLMNDIANGNADPSKVMSYLGSLDTQFWKGAMVGIGATLLLNNDAVKSTLAGAFSGIMGSSDKEKKEDPTE